MYNMYINGLIWVDICMHTHVSAHVYIYIYIYLFLRFIDLFYRKKASMSKWWQVEGEREKQDPH